MRYVLALDTEDGELAWERLAYGPMPSDDYDGGQHLVVTGLEEAEEAAAKVRQETGLTVWIQKLVSVAVYQGRGGAQ